MIKSSKSSPRKRVVMSKLTKNDKAFIEFVRRECKRVGIKMDLRPTGYLRIGNIRCSGYFDADNLSLFALLIDLTSLVSLYTSTVI